MLGCRGVEPTAGMCEPGLLYLSAGPSLWRAELVLGIKWPFPEPSP